MFRMTGEYDRIHVGANIPADRRLELFQLLKPGGLLCGVNFSLLGHRLGGDMTCDDER